MRQHVINGSVAAAIAASVSAGAIATAPVKQIVHQVNASKHAWPDLTDPERAALSASLKAVAGLRLVIVCADAACADLAQDVDDAAEDGGVESQLDRPMTPLGYGVGVLADEGDGRAKAVADALAAATSGRLKPELKTGAADGHVFVFIGKAPRK